MEPRVEDWGDGVGLVIGLAPRVDLVDGDAGSTTVRSVEPDRPMGTPLTFEFGSEVALVVLGTAVVVAATL